MRFIEIANELGNLGNIWSKLPECTKTTVIVSERIVQVVIHTELLRERGSVIAIPIVNLLAVVNEKIVLLSINKQSMLSSCINMIMVRFCTLTCLFYRSIVCFITK